MLQKYKKKTYILDQLHKAVVLFCMSFTVIGGVVIVVKGYEYYRYIRPSLREMQMKADEDLLEEGKYKAVG